MDNKMDTAFQIPIPDMYKYSVFNYTQYSVLWQFVYIMTLSRDIMIRQRMISKIYRIKN